jgi:hypothetical protein
VDDALGAPHVGERSERELIVAFVDRNRRAKSAAREVQRLIVRPAGPTIPRNDTQHEGARPAVRMQIFSIHPLRNEAIVLVPDKNLRGNGHSTVAERPSLFY